MRTALVVAVALLAAPVVRAQSASDKKRAEQLFTEARSLMNAKDYAAACPKFDESWRLDPAVGTAFNLGLCLEREGKLASAYDWYRKAGEAAEQARQQKRVDFARAELVRLEPMVPKIVIRAPRPTAGMTVVRGDAPVTLGETVRVDPGVYAIEATAPEHKPWKSEVTAIAGQTKEVEIPALEPLVVEPPPPPPAETRSSGRKTRLIISWSVIGAGAALTTVGLVFGLSAKSSWNDAREMCPEGSTSCSDEAVDLADSASSKATLATVFTTVGIVGIGAGVVLLLTAPKNKEVEAARIVPTVGPRHVGVSLVGSF